MGQISPHYPTRSGGSDRHGTAAPHDMGGELARFDPGNDRRRSRYSNADTAAACVSHCLVRWQLRPRLGTRGAADTAAAGGGGDLCLAKPQGIGGKIRWTSNTLTDRLGLDCPIILMAAGVLVRVLTAETATCLSEVA